MPYIEPSVIEQAKRIDLLTYLQQREPSELVRISHNIRMPTDVFGFPMPFAVGYPKTAVGLGGVFSVGDSDEFVWFTSIKIGEQVDLADPIDIARFDIVIRHMLPPVLF
jgi:hypothetical protein